MGCLPESGGCERRATEAFVTCWNNISGSSFEYVLCPDQVDRASPQPETLFADWARGKFLAVERKSVVWPLNYAARHRADHRVAEFLQQSLGPATQNLPVSLHLESVTPAGPEACEDFANEVARGVINKLDELAQGTRVVGTAKGLQWEAYSDQASRRFHNEPEEGLIVRWLGPMFEAASGEGIEQEMRRLLESAASKFRSYSDAVSVLLLEPFGSVRYWGAAWWAERCGKAFAASSISEIWLSVFDGVNDFEEGWIFERIRPHPHLEGVVLPAPKRRESESRQCWLPRHIRRGVT